MKNELRYVVMEQITICNWKIVTDTGHIMKEDITIGLYDKAEEYVKAYISSFSNLDYKMKPLKEKQ